MELSVSLNIFRFTCLFLSTFFLSSPLTYTALSLFSTIFYSLSTTFLDQSRSSIILHKCISRIPSMLLLIFTTSYEPDYRLLFLTLSVLEYLGLWISMYCEVITKEHSKAILNKGPILFADEFCSALHDAFLITHILDCFSNWPTEGIARSAYNFFMAGFMARVMLDVMNLVFNVLDIVELEVKKDS